MRKIINTILFCICVIVMGNSARAIAAPCEEARVVKVSLGQDVFAIPAKYKPEFTGLSERQKRLIKRQPTIYCQDGGKPWVAQSVVIFLSRIMQGNPELKSTALTNFSAIILENVTGQKPNFKLPGNRVVVLRGVGIGFDPIIIVAPQRSLFGSFSSIQLGPNTIMRVSSKLSPESLAKNVTAFAQLRKFYQGLLVSRQ